MAQTVIFHDIRVFGGAEKLGTREKTLPSPEVRSTLVTLGSAIKGLVVMSAALEVAVAGGDWPKHLR